MESVQVPRGKSERSGLLWRLQGLWRWAMHPPATGRCGHRLSLHTRGERGVLHPDDRGIWPDAHRRGWRWSADAAFRRCAYFRSAPQDMRCGAPKQSGSQAARERRRAKPLFEERQSLLLRRKVYCPGSRCTTCRRHLRILRAWATKEKREARQASSAAPFGCRSRQGRASGPRAAPEWRF